MDANEMALEKYMDSYEESQNRVEAFLSELEEAGFNERLDELYDLYLAISKKHKVLEGNFLQYIKDTY